MGLLATWTRKLVEGLALFAIVRGVFYALAERGVHPDVWVASMIDTAADAASRSTQAAAWILSGVIALGLVPVVDLIWLKFRDALHPPPPIRLPSGTAAARNAPPAAPNGPPTQLVGAPPTEVAETRIFVGPSVTRFYLTNLYNELTQIQADRLAQPYLGKWMRVSGAVNEIRSSLMGLMVSFKGTTMDAKPEDFIDTHMTFKLSWTDRLSILRRGDTITVRGKIQAIAQYNLFLENCELEP